MDRRHTIIFAAIFATICGLLTAVYLIFLRPDFAVLYQDIREADAAQIVTELEKHGIEYRLEDNGHRILVPQDDAGKARVLIAGSGIAMGGVVGFELFNETDMGLTEFAQKVNYQRALQGELARTIMAMDGIAFARVHLSLPERALFRAAKQVPKAAVTIQAAPSARLDNARVEGIQQLVSSAVTDLPAERVAILDDRGRLLSAGSGNGEQQPGGLTEKGALEEYYRARVQGVTERLIPGLPFRVKVLALANNDTSGEAPPSGNSEDQRNFRLRIAIWTEALLNSEDREILRSAITDTTGISASRGDSLRFEIGPLDQMERPFLAERPAGSGTGQQEFPGPAEALPVTEDWTPPSLFTNRWFWIALAVIAVIVSLLLRRRRRMSSEEQQSFAEVLGESIAMREAVPNGR